MSLYNPEDLSPLISSALVRVERRLPRPGEILVRLGARLEPEDVVGKAFLPAPLCLFNVAQKLGLAPNKVARAMRFEVGNKVERGKEIAHTGLFGGRKFLAPATGVLAAIDTVTGYVAIDPDPLSFELKANLRGFVADLQPHEGVIIETLASQVYGILGLGAERSGVLRLLVYDPAEVITHEQIDVKSTYAILIGGAGITAQALRQAVKEQVRGIIVGGIEEQELRAFLGWANQSQWQTGIHSWRFPEMQHLADPGLTLVVTEGFGIHPMTKPIFDLLSSLDGQEALIEGLTSLQRPFRRPRVIIPQGRSSGGQVQPPPATLRPGAQVRLLDTAHLGQVARVRALSAGPYRIVSGSRVLAVEVSQEAHPPFWVPQTAVEVLA